MLLQDKFDAIIRRYPPQNRRHAAALADAFTRRASKARSSPAKAMTNSRELSVASTLQLIEICCSPHRRSCAAAAWTNAARTKRRGLYRCRINGAFDQCNGNAA